MKKRGKKKIVMKKRENVKKKPKKEKKNSYFSKIGTAFKQTKLDKRFIVVYILDLIYTLSITSLVVSAGYYFLQKIAPIISDLSLENIASEQELLNNVIALIAPELVKLLGLGFLIFSILYIFLKGTIWRKVLRQKFQFSYYTRLILFNLLFTISLILVSIIFSFSETLYFISIIIFSLLVHFYFISLILFTKENKLFSGIGNGFKKGWKIWLFIVPYLILLLIQFASSVITGLISRLMSSSLSLTALSTNPTFIEMMGFFQEIIQVFPKTIPFLIIMGIIAVFFKTYAKIFYAEFVQQL